MPSDNTCVPDGPIPGPIEDRVTQPAQRLDPREGPDRPGDTQEGGVQGGGGGGGHVVRASPPRELSDHVIRALRLVSR